MRKEPHLLASCSALELSVTAQMHLGHQKHQHVWIWRVVSRPLVWYKVNPNPMFLNIVGLFSGTCFPVLDWTEQSRSETLGQERYKMSMKVQACVWEMVLPWTFLRK